MKTTIRAVCFPGFYSSIFDADAVWEREHDYYESEYPWHEWKYLNEWLPTAQYRKDVTEVYADVYIDQLNSELGLDIKRVGQSLWSPKEYNFMTDQIDIEVEIEDYDAFCKRLWSLMNEPEVRVRLGKKIKANHTSCDGFWSWMSNDIEQWVGEIAEDEGLYLTYFLWYLYEEYCGLEEPDDAINWVVLDIVQSNGCCQIEPFYDDAKEEWEAVQAESEERERKRKYLEAQPKLPGLEDY